MERRLSSGLEAPDHYGSNDLEPYDSPQNFLMQPTFPGVRHGHETPQQKAVNAAKASVRTPAEPKAPLKVPKQGKGRDYTSSSKRGPGLY